MTATIVSTGVKVELLKAETDGCVAYVVVDEATRAAFAVDPRLDQVEAIVALLAASGARLVAVADTHTHADHLSGARGLARRTGAEHVVHAASKARGSVRRLSDADEVAFGGARARVIPAPGHTPDSVAFLIQGHLFTGDALFVDGAGRTDFPGGSPSDLWDTFRRFEQLPDETVIHPGHDYVGRPSATLGEVRRTNSLLREPDRAALVARLSVRGPLPANVHEILRFNLGETEEAATLGPRDLALALEAGEKPLLLDVRTDLEFESERLLGSRNVPLPELATRLAELPEGPVVAICRTGVRATIAAETLARAGRPVRVLEGGVLAWRKAGLPLKEGAKHLAIDRQVQLVVGSAVLAGTLLGAFVHPAFLVLAGFFGAGLAFAGATGTCGLALVLAKAPWNRRAAPAACGSTCAAPAPPASVCAAPKAPG